MTTTPNTTNPEIPIGARVLNTKDGEPGVITNRFGHARNGSWLEYEVETFYGTEIWRRGDFILLDETTAGA